LSSRETEAEREPVEVDASPASREDTSWTTLTDAGFQYLGEWTLDAESIIQLDAKAPAKPGVYSFVVDDMVVYVGLTLSSLRTRFDQYRRGHEGQRTNARVNERIAQTLRSGKRVKVLVATPEPMEWQDLPVNTAAGLEAGLIQMIRPSWNIKGAR
jgi:excinuclease UvrABC nuclease subunit